MYPNPEMAKKLAHERAEAMKQAAEQHRSLQGMRLEWVKPFRRKLAFLFAKLAQRLDAEALNPKPS